MTTEHFFQATQANGYTSLKVDFANNRKIIPGITSSEQLRNIIKKTVAEAILRHAAHREQAFKKHNRLTVQRAQAIEKLRTLFSNYRCWRPANLKPKILQAQNSLYAILPPQTSRYFKSQSQMVTDVVEFAKDFHITKYIQ